MQLVQILLPLRDNKGESFPVAYYHRVRQEITKKFGGLTAYTRAPAEGLWKDGNDIQRDDIIIFEVMLESLDATWWGDYKVSLQELYSQDELIIRVQDIRIV